MSLRETVLNVVEEMGEASWRDVAQRLSHFGERQVKDAFQGLAEAKHLILVKPSVYLSGPSAGRAPGVYKVSGTRPKSRHPNGATSKRAQRAKKAEPIRPVVSVFEMGERAEANKPYWIRRTLRQDFATPEAA